VVPHSLPPPISRVSGPVGFHLRLADLRWRRPQGTLPGRRGSNGCRHSRFTVRRGVFSRFLPATKPRSILHDIDRNTVACAGALQLNDVFEALQGLARGGPSTSTLTCSAELEVAGQRIRYRSHTFKRRDIYSSLAHRAESYDPPKRTFWMRACSSCSAQRAIRLQQSPSPGLPSRAVVPLPVGSSEGRR